MPLTVGTAGHIDHGKTWLVRALTGKDTDRLPEEQERGISIELGYAPVELPGGERLSLVDVPGHERFVRTMVAGATGIDLFLLVIDAGEGARPQTHEHLAILRLLGVDRGVVAVTKADAVDSETLELAVAEAQELVPGAEVVPVSAKTGDGLDDLRAALGRAAAGLEHDRPGTGTRLYIDRAFTLAGVGTVVTGTLWSGSISPGDALEVQPSGLRARARTVHVHDMEVPRAEAGQRVAVNLPGIDRRKLHRGDALVEPGYYPVSWRLDVALEELEPVPAAVTVHIGTSDVAARVVRSGRFAQLRLREPAIAARGDRVVLRTDTTVGGGIVLDPAPPRGLDPGRLEPLERDDPEAIVRALVHEPVTGAELQARGLLPPAELARGLAALDQAGDWYFSPEWLEEVRASVRERLARRAEESPLDPGLPLAELLPPEPWAPPVAQLLHVERRDAKAYLPGAAPQLGEKGAAAAELEVDLESDYFSQIVVTDSALYSANGVFGGYSEKPAYRGPWCTIGLGFLEEQFISYDLGVRTVLPLPGGEILAGVWPFLPDTVSVYRFSPVTRTWSPSSLGIPRHITYDLERLGNGVILGATSGGLFASIDDGHTWNFQIREQAFSGSIYITSSRVYAGGETISQTPYLISSPDGTSEWIDMGIAGKIAFDKDGITGIFIREETSELFIGTSKQVFKSENAGDSFVPILNLACGSGVFGDQDSERLVALGDSVYLSDDDGGTWRTYPLPGQCFGPGNVDWLRNKVIVPVLMHDGGQLYGFEMP